MFDNDYIKQMIKTQIKSLFDELNKTLLVLEIILIILTLFVRLFILDLLKILIIIIVIFRLFSKNRSARYKENKIFLSIVTAPLKPFKKKIKDKNHIYKKCRKCKTILKLPLPDKRGIKHTSCPKCKKKITFITFRQTKIEVIKGEKISKRAKK